MSWSLKILRRLLDFAIPGSGQVARDFPKGPVAADHSLFNGFTAHSPVPPAESYIFRNSAGDAIQVPFLVKDITKRGWDKVAIFADTSGYGEAGLTDIEAAFKDKNIEAVQVTRFPLAAKDLSEELKASSAKGANVIFSMTVGPENAVIANGRKAIGWKVPQMGS